jgi:hypothetical protein
MRLALAFVSVLYAIMQAERATRLEARIDAPLPDHRDRDDHCGTTERHFHP